MGVAGAEVNGVIACQYVGKVHLVVAAVVKYADEEVVGGGGRGGRGYVVGYRLVGVDVVEHSVEVELAVGVVGHVKHALGVEFGLLGLQLCLACTEVVCVRNVAGREFLAFCCFVKVVKYGVDLRNGGVNL